MQELVEFCRERGGPVFGSWPIELLREHIEAHVGYGTLVWVRSPRTTRIAGVGTVWPCSADWLRYQTEHVFDGTWPEWTGTDALYLGDWVATERGALKSMMVEMLRRYDGRLIGKTFYAHRRGGRLVEVTRRMVWKLLLCPQ